jgi:thioredoxin reductase (NADPH)
LILAMGKSRKQPNIKGLQNFEGKGISYCAVCDAFFFRGKNVAVLGNGNYARHEAEYLSNVANSVIVLTNGEDTKDIEGFEVISKKISHLEGTERLERIVFDEGSIEVDGLFVAQGFAGATELATKLGVMCNDGNIIADENCKTNLDGCFAAGDCIGGILQLSTAVGEGAKAALSAIKYVKSK